MIEDVGGTRRRTNNADDLVAVREQDTDRERAELLDGMPPELWPGAIGIDDLISTTSGSALECKADVQPNTHVAVLHAPAAHHSLEVNAPIAVHWRVCPQLANARWPTLGGFQVGIPLDADSTG